MSTLSILIIGIILIGVFSLDMIRKSKLKMINACLEAKNYDAVISMAENKWNRKMLLSHTCDLYLLRASFLKMETFEFLSVLFNVYKNEVNEENKKDIMETYYHLYLYQKNEEAAQAILDKIMNSTDVNFKKVSQYAFDVNFHKNSEDLEEMEALVETLRSFELGACAYYIGEQYEQMGNWEMAQAYFQSCLGCFNESHYYAKSAKEHVEELTKKLA